MEFTTCDLYDKFEGVARVPKLLFKDFGARKRFCGEIATVKCYEDNSRVKELCSKPGNGRVLIVDGGGSIRCALLGDLIAKAAVQNAWAGVVVYGCIRDRNALASMDIGIKALGSVPAKSVRRGEGQVDVPLDFGGICWASGDVLFADEDGILLLDAQTARIYSNP
jgi:regulator of ribonuclease activity A